MGFHMEEDFVVGGTIDNRTKGRTLLKIHFANHTSSLVTLQGNPCRDLAGSLWSFKNPHARMDEKPGEQCFFIPALCEGVVGRISYTIKRKVPILPPNEHYDLLFDPTKDDPPTKIAPVLELEWFSQKYKQVEIDCQQMTLELVEMAWSLSPEEAAADEAALNQIRSQFNPNGDDDDDWTTGFDENLELIEEYIDDEPEPHELEELCFLLVQEFIINTADGSDEKQELHNILKLQEQIAGAFSHHNHDGEFDDIPATIRLLTALLPLIDRTAQTAKFIAETTEQNLLHLKQGIISLRRDLLDELADPNPDQ
jgi:hypothetical protein